MRAYTKTETVIESLLYFGFMPGLVTLLCVCALLFGYVRGLL